MKSLWLVFVTGAGALGCWAQQSNPDLQMRIVLEQQTGSTFRVVSPQHVFKTGDMVRFRVRCSSDGFLYVSNRAASGKYSELFPAKGADNKMQSGQDYRIPATAHSWFRIEKPPGYETVFFTFTSSLSRSDEAAPTTKYVKPQSQAAPAELMPRCDDAMFRARGECLDVNAGPSAVPAGDLAGPDALKPRDLSIVQGQDGSLVTPATPGDSPIIYEFRLAHR